MDLILEKHICVRLQLMSTREMNLKFHGLVLNFLFCFVQAWSTFEQKSWVQICCNQVYSIFTAAQCPPITGLQNSTLSVFADHHLCSLGLLSQCHGSIIIIFVI